MLKEEGKLVYKTRGISMEPMLRENRDVVVIRATDKRLKWLDVAFYKRGEQYVLHRVVRRKGDIYYILGDNTYILERVPAEDVLGVLVSFQRKGKNISTGNFLYKSYAFIWTILYPSRSFYKKSRHFAGNVLRKLGLRK